MVKGNISNGFNYSVDENKMDDMRFVDMLASLEDKPVNIGKVAEFLLGKEQKEKLYKHIEKDGKVSVEDFTEAFTEIMKDIPNGKKS